MGALSLPVHRIFCLTLYAIPLPPRPLSSLRYQSSSAPSSPSCHNSSTAATQKAEPATPSAVASTLPFPITTTRRQSLLIPRMESHGTQRRRHTIAATRRTPLHLTPQRTSNSSAATAAPLGLRAPPTPCHRTTTIHSPLLRQTAASWAMPMA